ncbi:unnamed protein product [Polarella glacialis]|uniref:Uncharacterized protein n=1 Tax=Polarella glacialis TaxID=89957 RepID=A0A813HT19_POLGL|nr:unnamed protein product [Polarella glacialis]
MDAQQSRQPYGIHPQIQLLDQEDNSDQVQLCSTAPVWSQCVARGFLEREGRPEPLAELRQLRLCNVEDMTGVLGVIALLQLLLSRAIQGHLQIALYLQEGCQVCPATISIGMGRLQSLTVKRSG